MTSEFMDGFKNRRISDMREALQNAYDAISAWRAENARLKARIQELELIDDIRKAHYLGLEAERDYLLAELDKAHGGAESNPARESVYKDTDIRIWNGPRKGEFVQMRDHHYFIKVAELIREDWPHLGCWKKLISNSLIHE
jgi:hypothetical protein